MEWALMHRPLLQPSREQLPTQWKVVSGSALGTNTQRYLCIADPVRVDAGNRYSKPGNRDWRPGLRCLLVIYLSAI